MMGAACRIIFSVAANSGRQFQRKLWQCALSENDLRRYKCNDEGSTKEESHRTLLTEDAKVLGLVL
jgi:hypothetical protein